MSDPSSQTAATAAAPETSGGILRLAELAFPRLDALDRSRTAVIFAASPLEQHGPHLPVGTDLFHAEFFNEELAKQILAAKPGWTVLIGPSIPVGASAFDQAGTLLARPRTVRNVTLDYGESLARHGFRFIFVTNAHAGPRHVVALEEAAAAVSRRHGVRMLSVSGPVLWKFMRGGFTDRMETLLGRPLTKAEREAFRGDSHGGCRETSLLMRVRPDLVGDARRELLPMRFTILDSLRKNYPLRLGNQMGYVGAPAAATPELGEMVRKILSEAVWEVARPVFDAPDDSWQQTSLLYRIPFFRTSFPFFAASAGILLLAVVWFWWLR